MQLKFRIKKQLFHSIQKIIGEKQFLRIRYRQRTGENLNLKNPVAFTEKIQYLKLYDRRPIYTECADKIAVKNRVRRILGEQYVIPTLEVFTDSEKLQLENFPDSPVIVKTNHDSGGAKVVFDKKKYDFQTLRRHVNRKLHRNFYYGNLEWEYKNIEPKILVEPLMSDESGNSLLNDYKIHCFHGKPKYIQTILDRSEGVKETWYDIDWNVLNMWYYSSEHRIIEKPKSLNKMLQISGTLSEPFPYVRIDLYDTPNQIYFGEYTFRPYGGFMKWNDKRWDYHLGQLIDLQLLSEYD